MKKTFALISIVAVFTAIVFGAWRFFRTKKTQEEGRQEAAQQYTHVTQDDGRTVTKPPESQESPIRLLSSKDTLAFWAYADSLYTMDKNGAVRLISTEEGGITVSEEEVAGIAEATPSPNGSYVVTRVAEPNGYTLRTFHTATNSWDPISVAAQDLAYSPDELSWARVKQLFDGTTVIEVASDKNPPREVARIAYRDARLSFIHPNRIIISSPPSSFSVASAFSIDITTNFVNPVATDRRGLTFLWSPSGNRGFVFWTDDQNTHNSAIIDSEGKIIKRLAAAFLPHKCAFRNEQEILCGAPKNILWPTVASLPDAYLQHTIIPQDQLVTIDAQSGRVRTLYNDGGFSFDIYAPKVSHNTLYFIDHQSGALYSLALQNL